MYANLSWEKVWPWLVFAGIVTASGLTLFGERPKRGPRLERVIEIYDDGHREVHEVSEDYYEDERY